MNTLLLAIGIGAILVPLLLCVSILLDIKMNLANKMENLEGELHSIQDRLKQIEHHAEQAALNSWSLTPEGRQTIEDVDRL